MKVLHMYNNTSRKVPNWAENETIPKVSWASRACLSKPHADVQKTSVSEWLMD